MLRDITLESNLRSVRSDETAFGCIDYGCKQRGENEFLRETAWVYIVHQNYRPMLDEETHSLKTPCPCSLSWQLLGVRCMVSLIKMMIGGHRIGMSAGELEDALCSIIYGQLGIAPVTCKHAFPYRYRRVHQNL